jgi:urea carboxylase
VRGEVDAGTFRYRYKEISFHPDDFLANPDTYNEAILGVLYGD